MEIMVAAFPGAVPRPVRVGRGAIIVDLQRR